MKLPWRESSPIIPILFWITVGLLAYAPFKADLVSLSDLEDNKDLIEVLSTTVGLFALLIGGTLSYIRFFRGRILNSKVDLDVQAECFQNIYRNLYSLEISISNRGSVSVWNYHVRVIVRPYPPSKPIDISDSLIQSYYTFEENLVNVGETSYEYVVIELDKSPFAYTFEVIVHDDSNTKWRRCLTVSNQ